ncbi:MAG: hypothetical protein J0I47_02500 [Sphingomonas sp.]|uniref:M61 family metallopeptidase n=1 Tax=Sphingomonas sp. TaxID=28214 RepID=UPI001ACA88E6|nr:hypothetical protein [Sphingomonas sp.]MBN8807097.1 hypothetical protein [Sphingomonas sp.]
MSVYRLAALTTLLTIGAAPASIDTTVAYELSPEMKDGAITALNVAVRLRADRSGTTTLDWMGSWAGDDRLGRWARDITVEGGTATPAPHGGRVVRSAPGARLTMRYRIVSAYAADPTVEDSEQSRPVIRPDWFYAVGETLYARPVDGQDRPARFAWKGPVGIGFASDTQHERGLNGTPRSVGDISESIAIGGRKLSVATITLNGDLVRVAHIGRFGFDGAKFDALAQRIVRTERAFWRDERAGPFLITAIPLTAKPGFRGFGGTGRSDAFATWIDQGADLSDMAALLAHEYFHSWNGRQLGRFADGAAAQAYWLSEGFTDFYTRRLLLRAGLWSPEDFIADWNRMLRAYAASPWRQVGNVAAAAKYWSGDYAAEKLPYQRGSLLAAFWDHALRTRGLGSLDEVLRAQRARVAASSPRPEIVAAFVAEMARAGLVVGPDVERYVTEGVPVLLPADAFGRCARVTTADVPKFERGWDSDATAKAGNVLTGIDPASNAYAAGLRDGMKIVKRIAGEPDNSAVDYVLEVEDGATVRRFTFRPAGRTMLRTQQIELDAARFAAEPAACARALSG